MRVIHSGEIIVIFSIDLFEDLGLIIDGYALAENALNSEVLLIVVEEIDEHL